jgi:hypothetical protein
MAPSKMSVAQKDDMFKDTQAGIQIHQKNKKIPVEKPGIVIDSRTSGISLGRYAKRKDQIGSKATAEIKRRQSIKKPIKEEVTGSATASGDGGVGGLGFNTGNPAIDTDSLNSYVSTNQLAKDKQNGAIMKMTKDSRHNILSFKAFDPNKTSIENILQYWNSDENGDILKSRKKT